MIECKERNRKRKQFEREGRGGGGEVGDKTVSVVGFVFNPGWNEGGGEQKPRRCCVSFRKKGS